VRKARASEAESFQTMVNGFMIWPDQIEHPDPQRAIRFAFIMVALALRELILFNRTRVFETVLPLDDDTLTKAGTSASVSQLPRREIRRNSSQPSLWARGDKHDGSGSA
jgi:hypothetical protein